VLQLQQSPEVKLLACLRCGGSSASRNPTYECLARYYSGYFSTGREQVTFDLSPRRFANHILGLISLLPQERVRILDFGGGDGTLSLAAAKLLIERGTRAVEIDIVDFQQSPVCGIEGVSISRAQSTLELGSRQYELVLASAIVEHLAEPREELVRLLAALAPGGCLYARTPWILPVLRGLSQLGMNVDFTFPAHLHDLGRNFWNRILSFLPLDAQAYRIRHAAPSIVETGFSRAPVRTLAAYALKAPARLFPSWPFVGGWEVVFERARE
jgi:hypothetical protein